MRIDSLLSKILNYSQENNISDIHLTTNSKPTIRDKNGDIVFLSELWWEELRDLSIKDLEHLMKEIWWEKLFSEFKETKDLDLSYATSDSERYRVNFYEDTNWYSIAMRLIESKLPTIEELWLWEKIKEMCSKSKWLILLTWPTWSWKSTNLAAMVNFINTNFKKHIITIEDPVEFSFKSDKSLINQREIWHHSKWFKESIKSALREDPDVIIIWEMRDPETIKSALTLAETWHLVISTLHTNDAVQTVDRIVDIFPSAQQKQIRAQLAMSLIWIVSQRLLPRKDNNWRIPAREIMIANDAVRNLIITWKSYNLYSVIEIWQREWMVLMDKYLVALYNKQIIDKDILMSYARDKEWVEMLIE